MKSLLWNVASSVPSNQQYDAPKSGCCLVPFSSLLGQNHLSQNKFYIFLCQETLQLDFNCVLLKHSNFIRLEAFFFFINGPSLESYLLDCTLQYIENSNFRIHIHSQRIILGPLEVTKKIHQDDCFDQQYKIEEAVPHATNDSWIIRLEICGKGGGGADLKGRWKIPENHGCIPSLEQTGGVDTDKSQWTTRLPIKIAEDGVKEMLQAVPELWYQKNTKNEQLCQ